MANSIANLRLKAKEYSLNQVPTVNWDEGVREWRREDGNEEEEASKQLDDLEGLKERDKLGLRFLFLQNSSGNGTVLRSFWNYGSSSPGPPPPILAFFFLPSSSLQMNVDTVPRKWNSSYIWTNMETARQTQCLDDLTPFFLWLWIRLNWMKRVLRRAQWMIVVCLSLNLHKTWMKRFHCWKVVDKKIILDSPALLNVNGWSTRTVESWRNI